jgi:hypothetical protein
MTKTNTNFITFQSPITFSSVDGAVAQHRQTDILTGLCDPWPLADGVLFKSSPQLAKMILLGVDQLEQLIAIGSNHGIDVAPLQAGLQAYAQNGGNTLADMRAVLFDHYPHYGADCSLAHLQGLKLDRHEFVFHHSHDFKHCHQFVFTDPQIPDAVHQFSVAQIDAFLKDAGDDKKLIPEFVKAQKQAAKMKWQDRVTSVALLGGVLGLMGLVVYKGNQHQAEKYFDPDEVVSNRATGRYLVNTERGTIADGPLPSKPGEVARVYDIDSLQQKTVTLSSAGFYQTSSFSPVTDYQKLGQVVAAWNRVQGQGEVNAARLTEIFAREAKLATELQEVRVAVKSAVAPTP